MGGDLRSDASNALFEGAEAHTSHQASKPHECHLSRAVLKGGVWGFFWGGGGFWDPKMCVPKMARQDVRDCKLGGGGLGPPSSEGVQPKKE